MSNSNDQSAGVKFGFILGVATILVVSQLPFSDLSKAQKALAECQKALPRNQRCVIVAVPENNEPIASNSP